MKGFFPAASVEIPSAHPSAKAAFVHELGASGILLKQRFGMHFWFHMPGRAGSAEAVTIRRDYFEEFEEWLDKTALRANLDEDGQTKTEGVPQDTEEVRRHGGMPRGDIDAYFAAAEAKLRLEFQQRRSILTDSDVKAGENERAVGDFLQKHVAPGRIAINKQIIDSHRMTSGEMDVCSCNFDQPSVDIPLVIAEGVDFVVQVKAILTDAELGRIAKNCQSLKRLQRRFSEGDEIFAGRPDVPFLVERIPYFVLAFESELLLQTVSERLSRILEDELPVHWPDGVFILNRGAIQHLRVDDQSFMRVQATENKTMLKFLQQIHSVARNLRRLRSPLVHYFPTDVYHPR